MCCAPYPWKLKSGGGSVFSPPPESSLPEAGRIQAPSLQTTSYKYQTFGWRAKSQPTQSPQDRSKIQARAEKKSTLRAVVVMSFEAHSSLEMNLNASRVSGHSQAPGSDSTSRPGLNCDTPEAIVPCWEWSGTFDASNNICLLGDATCK